MFQGIFKSYLEYDNNTKEIFGSGALPINIKIAQLVTFANSDTKKQGYYI